MSLLLYLVRLQAGSNQSDSANSSDGLSEEEEEEKETDRPDGNCDSSQSTFAAPEYQLVLACLCVVAGLAVVFNSLVVLVIMAKMRKMVTSIIVCSLALADFLLASMYIPLELTPNYVHYYCTLWPRQKIILSCLAVSSQMTSILHVLFLTVDRFFAIVYPLSYHNTLSSLSHRCLKTAGLCLVLWLASLTFNGLWYTHVHVLANTTEEKTAAENAWSSAFNVVVLVSLSLIGLLYLPIIRNIIAVVSEAKPSASTSSLSPTSDQEPTAVACLPTVHLHTAVTVLLIYVFFVVCYLPDCVLFLGLAFNAIEAEVFGQWYPLIVTMKLFNTVINPVVYCMRTKAFWRAVKSMGKCKREG